jgi:hypothetical protein
MAITDTLKQLGYLEGSTDDAGVVWWRSPHHDITVSIVDDIWETARDTKDGFVVNRGTVEQIARLKTLLANSLK